MKTKPRCFRIQQITFTHTALLLGLLASMLLMPLIAESANDKREPLDLSILERQAELTRHMTRSERIQLAQFEAAVNQAQSDLRTGQFMIEVEYTPMQPDRDVAALNERGKKIIAEAEASLYQYQKAIVELLEGVNTGQQIAQAADETAFDLELDAVPFGKAMETASEQVLEACWEKGYGALFYHEVFIRDYSGIRRAGSKLRNEVYDTLVAIDGTNFTLNLPIGLKLKAETTGVDESPFTFESDSAFERVKKALLVIEMIIPENSTTGLLSIRAINMETQRIAAAGLIKITNFPALLNLEEPEEPTDRAVRRIEIRGGAKNIELVADLPEDYRFELQTDSVDRQSETLITYTLFRNSGLSLVDSDFIREAYGADLTEPEDWRGRANGRIVVAGISPENQYEMGLQVEGAERVLPAGTITVFSEDSEANSTPID